ncbi:MAG: metallopeptidase family protein [Chloroflexota bacterium]
MEGQSAREGPRRRRRLSQEEHRFEHLVAEAIDDLPPTIRQRLANVDVVVEEEPAPYHLAEAGLSADESLFGLYQGIPQTQRTAAYGMALPDKITIFRGPIERFCRSRREIREQVRETILHEFAHHFGISDAELDDMGL